MLTKSSNDHSPTTLTQRWFQLLTHRMNLYHIHPFPRIATNFLTQQLKNKTGKSTDFFFNTDHLEWTPCWDERGNLNSCLCFLHNCVCLFVLSGSNCFLCFPVFSTFECCMNSFVVSSSLVGLALLPWMTLVMKLMGWGDRFHVHPLHQSNVCVILLMFRYAVKV